MVIKWIICLLILSNQMIASNAPVFPEVRHFFDASNSDNNALNYVFNGRLTQKPTNPSISFAHQSREWDYQWYVLATTIPLMNDSGILSVGASIYTSPSLPVTSSDSIGPYISSYDSDTFFTLLMGYQPNINGLNAQFILSSKYRKLMDVSASQAAMDIHVSSPYILNNRLGIRSTNLLSSNYTWSTGKQESLAKYIGIYFFQPIYFLQVLIEYDYAINYENMNIFMSNAAFNLAPGLSVFSTFRIANTYSVTSVGTKLELSKNFVFDYISQTESYTYGDENIQSISIGVIL